MEAEHECFVQNGIEFAQQNQALLFSISAGILVVLILVRKWLVGGVCQSLARLDGKTVVITGANSGIGKETARDLAKRGARVILACRNLTTAMEVAAQIGKDISGAAVSVRKLDLASLKSIRKFAKDILATEKQIDILINNAGLISSKVTTEDGFDMTFGTNHLGHFLLTLLLLDKIKDSSPSRIVNVSSMGHMWAKMNWEDLHYEKNYKSFTAYIQSKLANILFTKELARRLQGTGTTVYAVHPGAVRTNFGKDVGGVFWTMIMWVAKLITMYGFKNCTQGAQTTIHCAVSEQARKQSGLYYSDCAVKQPSSNAVNEEDAKRLWDISLKMVGLEENKYL